MADSLYKPGDKVRGVPGRISENILGNGVDNTSRCWYIDCQGAIQPPVHQKGKSNESIC